MNYAIDTHHMRDFDAQATEIIPEMILMENAGRIIAGHIVRDFRASHLKTILILAGTGHNGGDALVAARHLNNKGIPTRIFLVNRKLKPLTQTMLETLDSHLSTVSALSETGPDELIGFLKHKHTHCAVVDGVLGSGIRRPISDSTLLRIIEHWNRSAAFRYAIDVPSGISDISESAETPPPVFFHADCTLAIQFSCTAFYGNLREYCGKIRHLEIGFPAALLRRYTEAQQEQGLIPLLETEDLPERIPPISADAHKGKRGKVEVFAGSRGMEGSAVLAARATLHSGAGMVRIDCPSESIIDEVLKQEAAIMTDTETKPGSWGNCLLAGPGWGRQTQKTTEVMMELIQSNLPLVVDADGFRNLKALYDAGGSAFRNNLRTRGSALVLTPHPGEAAVLLEDDIAEVLCRPLRSVQRIAERYHAHVVLKNSVNHMCTPQGRVCIHDSRLPALGTAGSGDVLVGTIAGLLARGVDADNAVSAAVLLHAGAGRRCFLNRGWFTASQLLETLSTLAGEIQYRNN